MILNARNYFSGTNLENVFILSVYGILFNRTGWFLSPLRTCCKCCFQIASLRVGASRTGYKLAPRLLPINGSMKVIILFCSRWTSVIFRLENASTKIRKDEEGMRESIIFIAFLFCSCMKYNQNEWVKLDMFCVWNSNLNVSLITWTSLKMPVL